MVGETERISAGDDDTAPKCAQEPSPRPTAPAVRWPSASRHRRFILPPPRPPVPPPWPPYHTQDRLPARSQPPSRWKNPNRWASAADAALPPVTAAADTRRLPRWRHPF